MDSRRFLDQPRVLAFPGFSPTPWAPIRMGQLVSIQPELTVEAPITVELGSLPLSLGLFAGSAIVFLVKGELPKGWPQSITTILGAGLAAFGIVNLVLPRAAAAPGAPGLPAAAPVTPGETSAALPITTEDSFISVGLRVVSPPSGTIIDLGPFEAANIPVRIRVSNDAPEQAAFDLVLEVNEQPNIGAPQTSKMTTRVVLGPQETRDVDLEIPLVTWEGIVDDIRVIIYAGKQRLAGGKVELLDQSTFMVD